LKYPQNPPFGGPGAAAAPIVLKRSVPKLFSVLRWMMFRKPIGSLSMRRGMGLLLLLAAAIALLVAAFALLGFGSELVSAIILGVVFGIVLFVAALGMMVAMSASRGYFLKKR